MSKKRFINNVWQFAWSKWTICITLFLAPLYASTSHWYPFTTPKTLVIIGGTVLSAIFFLWGFIENKEEKIKVTKLHIVLFAFLLIMSLAGFFGIDPHTSFFGTFFSSVGIVFLINLGLLACLISEFIRRDLNFVQRLLLSVFASGVLVAGISYLPLLGFQSKILETSTNAGSTIGNSSFTGAFLMFAVGFGGYLALTLKRWRDKLFIALGILTILFCPTFFNEEIWRGSLPLSEILRSPLLLSGESQGAQLGVIVLAFSSVFLWLAVSPRKIMKVVGIIFLIFFMTGLSWSYIGLLDPASKIHQHFAEVKKGTRFVFWDIGERAVAEKPFLGWGFENYQTVYQRYFDPIVFEDGYTNEQGVTNPHNIIYDMAVSSGIVGLLAYLTLFGFTSVVFIKFAGNKEGKEKWIVVFSGILLGYFIQNFFIFDNPTSWLVYFLSIGLAMGFLSIKNQTANPHTNTSSIGVGVNAINLTENILKRKIIGWSVAGLFGVSFFIFVVLPMHESRQWQNLRQIYLFDRIDMVKNVPGISLMGGVDDDARYANEVLGLIDEFRREPDTSLESEKILGTIFSTVEILKNNKESAGNFYANYEAGMLLHLAFVIDPKHDPVLLDEARIFLENARDISKLNPRVYYNLAQNELFRQNMDKAVSLIKAGMAIGLKDEGQRFLDRILK